MEIIASESNVEKVVQNLSIYAKALKQVVQKVGLSTDPTDEKKKRNNNDIEYSVWRRDTVLCQ